MPRADLFSIIKVKKLRTLTEVMKAAGVDKDAIGCEICKPSVGSILSSLYVTPHTWEKSRLLIKVTPDIMNQL